MKMHHLFVVFICLFSCTCFLTTHAQENHTEKLNLTGTAKNTLYLELAGSGFVYSLNYDRIIAPYWTLRGGFSFLPLGGLFNGSTSTSSYGVTPSESRYSIYFTSLPVSVSYLYNFGGTPSNLEFGIGPTFTNLHIGYEGSAYSRSTMKQEQVKIAADNFLITLGSIIGYRYQLPEGGICFRAFLAPFLPLLSQEFGIASIGNGQPQTTNRTGTSYLFGIGRINLTGGISIGYSF